MEKVLELVTYSPGRTFFAENPDIGLNSPAEPISVRSESSVKDDFLVETEHFPFKALAWGNVALNHLHLQIQQVQSQEPVVGLETGTDSSKEVHTGVLRATRRLNQVTGEFTENFTENEALQVEEIERRLVGDSGVLCDQDPVIDEHYALERYVASVLVFEAGHVDDLLV